MYPRKNTPSVQSYLSKVRNNPLFHKTRQVTAEQFDKTRQVTAQQFDKTRQVTAQQFDKTRQVTAQQFDKTREFAARKPKVALGVTAAGAVAVAGIATGIAAIPAPASQVSHAAAASHLSLSSNLADAAGQSGQPSQGGPSDISSVQHPRTMQKTSGKPTQVKVVSAKKKDDSAPAKHHAAPVKHKSSPASPAKPYLVYDSVTPSSIPAHQAAAAYATGGYAASASQLKGHDSVVWIDTNGSDPKASALDVEPGDATPTQAASWAKSRLNDDPNGLARIYTMRSEWDAVKSAVASLSPKMQSHIRWWIADPTGSPHVVPGAAATQWFWGAHYDISTATPRF